MPICLICKYVESSVIINQFTLQAPVRQLRGDCGNFADNLPKSTGLYCQVCRSQIRFPRIFSNSLHPLYFDVSRPHHNLGHISPVYTRTDSALAATRCLRLSRRLSAQWAWPGAGDMGGAELTATTRLSVNTIISG